MAISFRGAHFPQDIMLMGVRWYVAYPLSYRHMGVSGRAMIEALIAGKADPAAMAALACRTADSSRGLASSAPAG
jgi:hypothetical protein